MGNSSTIRDLADDMETELHARAARNGRSVEEEARVLLAAALAQPVKVAADGLPWSLGETARLFFGPENGIDLDLPPREPMREPPDFGWALEEEDEEAAEGSGSGGADSDP